MVFRVKKTKNYTVMSNYHLRDKRLSLKAKGLLSQMLSLPDDWNYTVKGLAAINKEHFNTIRAVILELERAGYIVRRQKREDSGEWSRAEYDIYEIPQAVGEEEPEAETGTDAPETEAGTPPPPPTKADAPELDPAALNRYRKEIRENIDYDWLWQTYGADLEILSEYVSLMAEVCAGKETIKVNGREIPAKEAELRFLSLNRDHILYVMDRMKDTRREIHNIRAYTLAALYNAPNTINQYYKSKMSSDYYKLKEDDD